MSFIGEQCDREAEIFRKEAFSRLLWHIKAGLANRVLMTMGFVLTEIGLTVLMMEEKIHLGYFVALSIGVYRCLEQIGNEVNVMGESHEVRLFLRQWDRFLHLPEMEENTWNYSQMEKETYEPFETLEFRHVSFRYPRTGRYVLHDLSFRIDKGGYYAFVGSNGSGKTTIVKLLSGLYDAYEGEILVNGVELREIPAEERSQIFGVLFQDAARFQDTMRGNIFGREGILEGTKPGAMEEKLAEEWILSQESGRFPMGLDTFLGSMEDGVILSEGEWQRLLLCRLFAQCAQVRVMDEPMASLDIFWQSKVNERILHESQQETMMIFSHHMAAVSQAKRIFVLKEGAIAEEGAHEQLLEKRGLYAKMYEAQKCGGDELIKWQE